MYCANLSSFFTLAMYFVVVSCWGKIRLVYGNTLLLRHSGEITVSFRGGDIPGGVGWWGKVTVVFSKVLAKDGLEGRTTIDL